MADHSHDGTTPASADTPAPETPEIDAPEGPVFAMSDYFATGEGRTVSILVGALQPKPEEWAEAPGFTTTEDGALAWREGRLALPRAAVIERMFVDAFGAWLGQGCEIMDRATFLDRARPFLPEALVRMLESKDPPYLAYQGQLHFNYS